MYTLITVLIFIVCVLLILIVLVQNSKGGGLASNFQSTGQMMGVRKTNDFLEKATWFLAGSLLVLAVLGSAFIPRQVVEEQSRVQDQIENAIDPSQVPTFPTTPPETATPNQQTTPPPASNDANGDGQ